MGTYDAYGFYTHGEADTAVPGGEFSQLLNLPPEGAEIIAYVNARVLAQSTNPVDSSVAAAISAGSLTAAALAARNSVYVANSLAARDAFWGATTSAAQRLALHNKGAMTVRTDRGFVQQYFATVADGVPAIAAAAVAGWYIVLGKKPVSVLTFSSTIPSATETVLGTTSPARPYAETTDNDGMHDPSTNPERITMVLSGDYEVEILYQWAASATGRRYVRVRKNGTAGAALTPAGWVDALGTPADISDGILSFKAFGAAPDYLTVSAYQNSGAALLLTATVTTRYLGIL